MLGPNITGSLNMCDAYFVGASGAFEMAETTNNYTYGDAKRSHVFGARFSANKDSAMFGAADTLQPTAFQILIIIKVWQAGGWTVEFE